MNLSKNRKHFFTSDHTPDMLHRLHLRLTALCFAVTGLIVAVLSVICLLISESGIRNQEYASFLSNLNAMYQSIEMQSALSHQWLRQTEHNYQFDLRIIDNGKPLLFERIQEPAQNTALLDLAEETAAKEHGISVRSAVFSGSLIRHVEFPLNDESGRHYYASAALLPHSGGVIGITTLHSLQPIQTRIWKQRSGVLLADIAAMLFLSIFFWYFTTKMIRPLQENREKQNQFIAAASHELRSPLTVILSNTAAVRSRLMPNDDQFLASIEAEGNRMSRLVRDMLELAGADNRSWSIQPAETELDTLLLQTWEQFEAQAYARKLSWDISLPDEELPRCLCDAERIRQLLSILIDNAFSYTPEHGKVRLSLTAEPSMFRIAVSDNGPGVPDDQKQAVFERFYRADPARKNKSHFGLGLCIAKEIALLHKGQLFIEDTPGGGATFVLHLPQQI